MKQARLVGASLTHVGPLSLNMREADRIECEAMGRTPKQALRLSLSTSLFALSALDPDDDKPLAMFGVSPVDLMSGIGVPWFLGREEVYDYGRDLMARGPTIIADWQRTFSVMENLVSASNVRAIALLKRWGATVGGPSVSHSGVDFVPFRFQRQEASLAVGCPT